METGKPRGKAATLSPCQPWAGTGAVAPNHPGSHDLHPSYVSGVTGANSICASPALAGRERGEVILEAVSFLLSQGCPAVLQSLPASTPTPLFPLHCCGFSKEEWRWRGGRGQPCGDPSQVSSFCGHSSPLPLIFFTTSMPPPCTCPPPPKCTPSKKFLAKGQGPTFSWVRSWTSLAITWLLLYVGPLFIFPSLSDMGLEL